MLKPYMIVFFKGVILEWMVIPIGHITKFVNIYIIQFLRT